MNEFERLGKELVEATAAHHAAKRAEDAWERAYREATQARVDAGMRVYETQSKIHQLAAKLAGGTVAEQGGTFVSQDWECTMRSHADQPTAMKAEG